MTEQSSKALYVFSDVHLGGEDAAREKIKLDAIAKLFTQIKQDGNRLIILGDLFDFWFEYGFPIPQEHNTILAMLADLRKQGIAVDYICGNHDFWMEDYFPKQLDIPIHRDEFDLTRDGKQIHCIHGDGLAPADKGYRIMKSIFRNRLCIWLYSLLPASFATNFAKRISKTSRGHNPGRDYRFAPDYEQYAKTKLDSGYDVVLLGHLHLPVEKGFGAKTYINTGDFIQHFSYAKMVNGVISLHTLS